MSTPPIVTEYGGPTPYKLNNVVTGNDVFTSNTPFYPNQISDLAIWLDGKDILNNGSNNPEFGDLIPIWANKAPNTITVSQSTPARIPICATGNNGVSFSNTNDGSIKNGYNTTYGGAYSNETIFILLKNDNIEVGGNNYNLLFPSAEGGRQLSLLSNSTTISRLATARFDLNTPLVVGDVTINVTTLVSARTSFNFDITHYINGGESGTTEMDGYITGGTTVIGTDNYGNQGFNGTMYEIIIYSNALSDNDRNKVESYLRWKWNTFTLDPTNPYANQPYSNIVYTYPNINSNVIPPVPRNLFSGLPGLNSNNYPLISNFLQTPFSLRNRMF